jgi:Cu2+-containing amine oxidase
MVVPYGGPDGNWVWRNAFDEGEYGLGRLATPLEPGKDAPDFATGPQGEDRPLERDGPPLLLV